MIPHSQIANLALKRVRPRDIAHQLGLHPDEVYASIRKSRSVGVDIPFFNSGRAEKAALAEKVAPIRTPTVPVPMRLKSLLDAEAAKKGITPTELAQRLLERALLGTVSS